MNLSFQQILKLHAIAENASQSRVPLSELCLKLLNVDIVNDPKVNFLRHLDLYGTLFVDSTIMMWLGINRPKFIKLLKSNKNVIYSKLDDAILMRTLDFETIMMQIQTSTASELRTLYKKCRAIVFIYMQYEQFLDGHMDK